MHSEENKKLCKKKIREYLIEQGLPLNRHFHCLSPDHSDRNPSMSFNSQNDTVHCFSCTVTYDLFDLIRLETGLEGRDLFEMTFAKFGINSAEENKGFHGKKTNKIKKEVKEDKTTAQQGEEDFSDYFSACYARLAETDYPQRRGLSHETLKRFQIGYDPEWKHPKVKDNPNIPFSPRLIIPISKGSYLARDTRSSIPEAQKNYIKSKVGKTQIFNAEALKQAKKPIYIVEAELDALSVIEAGGEAVGLGGVNKAREFINLLKQTAVKNPLILALDNDEQGQKTSSELESELEILGYNVYVFNPSKRYKDPSEALEKEREHFIQSIQEGEALDMRLENTDKGTKYQAYLRTTSAYYRLEGLFEKIKERVHLSALSTGFAELDKALGDGLYEGLYVVGAISSIGKTTLFLQIMDQLAQAGNDVLIFSLEMSKDELIAKSLSRLSCQVCSKTQRNQNKINELTTRDILTGLWAADEQSERFKLFSEASRSYQAYGQKVFILEGSGDKGVQEILADVKNHIKMTGRTPVVLVDYLQILEPNNIRGSDKQNVDKSVVELKRLSRDCRTPVIVISSFNRGGYQEAVKMESFKESGAIEYSADVLMGLQFKGARENKVDVEVAKKQDPRLVELVVLKNRNGPSGSKVSFKYYPRSNYFEEEN